MNNSARPSRPVALVTGASRGIGAAIAIELAARGFDIAIMAIDDASETAAAIEGQGARALAFQGNLADVAEHASMLESIALWGGPVTCLVNNAGIGSPKRGDLLDVQPEAFDLVLDTNLRGTFFLTQQVARQMVGTPSGAPQSIITVSSVSAELASVERGEYCLSKAGLGMLTKLFALRLAKQGVGVFEIRPGVIRTAMTAGVADKYDRLIAQGLVPMDRWGLPEDIARVVAELASGRFAFATGSVINVDGALSIPRL
ncbi:NAD(P)-dependent dehydrogenase, short-chain alcohol dehydrogenase family [Variovorax sp. HW608]|uniref:3-ketoacyl-ACP reductase n=1 Tax=Variovorax sp. HW608 TaxID=1034889 RepID=UPI00081FF731|nr:3-ketoacyl-ACP reductase [Variovorax sp. HW608]SCK21419.1 NAD(P)-dependent dehydrogenase, short-chain alcohol dehydrogenase family [Variovorax sp. HW608]